MTTWLTHGLVVHSETVTIDARPTSSDTVPDVEFTLCAPALEVDDRAPAGRLMAESYNGEFKYLTVVEQEICGASSIVARFHGLGTARVALDGSAAELVPDPGWDRDYAAVLFNGTIMAMVLALKGHAVLHASAVAIPRREGAGAIAFVGSSGMGKSTVATLICRDGGQLVTDDLLRTDLADDGGVLAWPGAQRTRLRPGAHELAMAAGDDVQETADGRSAPRLAAAPDRAVPLLALAVPLPNREVDRPNVRRLYGAEAVFALARYPRIVGWTDARTSKKAHQHWGELLRRLPVVEVDVPWGPPFGHDLGRVVAEAILQQQR